MNKKWYVGSSNNINRRWRNHKSELRKNLHHNPYLQNAWNKDGENSFIFIKIDFILPIETELERIEQKYLDYAKTIDNVYNIKFYSAGQKLMSEKTKLKLTISHQGKKISDEIKEKIKKTLTGYKHTDEAKLNMSKNQKGKIVTIETRNKIRNSNKGRKMSETTKTALAFANQHRKPEFYEKNAKTRRNNVINKLINIGLTKNKLHYLIWNYGRISDIARLYNTTHSSISDWCKFYDIKYIPCGYWTNIKNGKIIDYQI